MQVSSLLIRRGSGEAQPHRPRRPREQAARGPQLVELFCALIYGTFENIHGTAARVAACAARPPARTPRAAPPAEQAREVRAPEDALSTVNLLSQRSLKGGSPCLVVAGALWEDATPGLATVDKLGKFGPVVMKREKYPTKQVRASPHRCQSISLSLSAASLRFYNGAQGHQEDS